MADEIFDIDRDMSMFTPIKMNISTDYAEGLQQYKKENRTNRITEFTGHTEETIRGRVLMAELNNAADDMEIQLNRCIGSVHAQFIRVDKQKLAAFSATKLTLAAKKIVYQVGLEARDMARRLCPIKTGSLRASIYVTSPGGKPENIKQRTYGYWQAINAASRRSGGKLTINLEPDMISNPRTQHRLNSLTIGNAYGGKNIFQKTTGGKEDVFSRGQFSEHDVEGNMNTPGEYDFMPMSVAGEDSFYVSMGVAAYYAGYVEFGTSRFGPHSFFTPAMEWGKKETVRRLSELIRNGV
jgi:hypothetical protein